MFIGLGAVAVGVAIAAGAAVALWPHGPDASVVYSQKVARVFGPVLGANRQVSNTLATLHGTRPANARLAVRRAQQQTTIAVGALGALSVPHGSEQLAGDARQVLDRENAYLSAVGAVLNHPRTASAGELQTLASNLTSSFSAAGPTVAGTSQTVSGANTLKAWVQRTREVLVHQARVKAEHKHAGTPATNAATASTGGGSAVTTNPYANGRDCGGGVYAGPNTSCSFAFNVREAYDSAPGLTASVQAYSPATGETYAMDCAPSGSGTTCSGANDASVTF